MQRGSPSRATTGPSSLSTTAMTTAAIALTGLAFLCGPAPARAAPAFEDMPVTDSIAERALPCTVCHGAQGRATRDGYFPRIAGKPAGYLLSQLRNFREGRRQNSTMLGLIANLDDRYLAEMAGYFADQHPPYPPTQPLPGISAAQIERGRQLVERGDPAREIPACSSCHGRQLTGARPFIPGLAGLPADYIAAQIGAYQAGRRRSHAPDCMATIANRLQPADVASLNAWLSALPAPSDGAAPVDVATLRPLPLDCAGAEQ